LDGYSIRSIQETIVINVVSLPEVGRVMYFENYDREIKKRRMKTKEY
jgi:hypothetical protein